MTIPRIAQIMESEIAGIISQCQFNRLVNNVVV